MDYLIPLLSAFAVVAVAEFGDKTQIAIISLSAKRQPKSVFAGALLAFILIDGASALIGGAVAPFVPWYLISSIAGISFLIFGIYTLLSRQDLTVKIKERKKIFSTAFFLIGIMEVGDKTQLAVVALSAQYNAPLQVFLGVVFAMALVTAFGLIFGTLLCKYVSARYTKIGSGLIFIAFGVLFLVEVITGNKIM